MDSRKIHFSWLFFILQLISDASLILNTKLSLVLKKFDHLSIIDAARFYKRMLCNGTDAVEMWNDKLM